MTTTPVIAADIAAPTRHEIASFCQTELGAIVTILRDLDREQWRRPTDCTGWTVRDLAAHLLGQYQGQASPVVMLKRVLAARANHPDMPALAAHNQQQIEDLRYLSTDELIAAIEWTGARAIRAVERTPSVIRRLGTRRLFPEEQLVDPHIGYILDVLTCRDPWMHRLDLCRATGIAMSLRGHDRLVIEQVLAELGRQWTDEPLLLHLAAPIEGSWLLGERLSQATTEMWADPLEVMRLLAGRPTSPISEWGVDGDPHPATALAAARIVF